MVQDKKANLVAAAAKVKKPGLDRSIQSHIGRKLKALYHSFAAEPVPDGIVELLQKLEAEEQARAAAAQALAAHAHQPGKSDGSHE